MSVSIGNFVKSSLDVIKKRGEELSTSMEKLLEADNVSPEDMLVVNYELGQYNSLLEVTSSINKSLLDTLKSLAQRTG